MVDTISECSTVIAMENMVLGYWVEWWLVGQVNGLWEETSGHLLRQSISKL
jgi:hypothetical protein